MINNDIEENDGSLKKKKNHCVLVEIDVYIRNMSMNLNQITKFSLSFA